MLIKSLFYVNNLTPNIINTKYTTFMHTNCVYSTNNPIYLTLFSSASTTKGSQFLFVNIDFFLRQTPFFTVCFDFRFLFFFFCLLVCLFSFPFNLIFSSFSYLSFALLKHSFARRTNNDFIDFATLVRKIN